MQQLPQNIARRARLSTGAIVVAIILTIAAVFALSAAIGRPEMGGYEIQNPVSPLDMHKVSAGDSELGVGARN